MLNVARKRLSPGVIVLGVGGVLERLDGNLQFLSDLALGETAATEVQRRWNAEGAKHPPMLSPPQKQRLEASE